MFLPTFHSKNRDQLCVIDPESTVYFANWHCQEISSQILRPSVDRKNSPSVVPGAVTTPGAIFIELCTLACQVQS